MIKDRLKLILKKRQHQKYKAALHYTSVPPELNIISEIVHVS